MRKQAFRYVKLRDRNVYRSVTVDYDTLVSITLSPIITVHLTVTRSFARSRVKTRGKLGARCSEYSFYPGALAALAILIIISDVHKIPITNTKGSKVSREIFPRPANSILPCNLDTGSPV